MADDLFQGWPTDRIDSQHRLHQLHQQRIKLLPHSQRQPRFRTIDLYLFPQFLSNTLFIGILHATKRSHLTQHTLITLIWQHMFLLECCGCQNKSQPPNINFLIIMIHSIDNFWCFIALSSKIISRKEAPLFF